MLCLIPIVGGLQIMTGQHDRSEALFYYLRLEDQIPENHLLRLIDRLDYPSLRQSAYLNQASLGLIGRPAVTAMHTLRRPPQWS